MLHTKKLFLLMTLLIAGVSSGLQTTQAAIRSTTSGDGDGNIVIRPRGQQPIGGPRMPSTTSIVAHYDASLTSVCAYLSNAGDDVEVEFNNLTTGEYYSYEIPGSGLSVMPIGGNPGYWTVSFTLSSGAIYDGEFNI